VADERSRWRPVEFNAVVVLSLESTPRGRGNGGAAPLRKGKWRRRSARWQPAGRVAAARASEGRRRRRSELSWARVAGWAECHLGRCGEKTKKREMGRKDD
jgi:hypothetical protein